MGKRVVILAETRDGQVRNVAFEAIAAARTVAGSDGEVVAVVLGDSGQSFDVELGAMGADKVVTVTHPHLKFYTSDGYAQALFAILSEEQAEGLVLGHTALGKDLAPKIAAKRSIGCVSDVVSLEEAGGNVIFTRPIYSGKAFEKVIITEPFVFFTIRPNNIAVLEKADGRTAPVVSYDVDIKNLRAIVKEVVRKSTGGVDLSEAKVIVAGGRGVKSKDGFKPLEELASVLGAAVGASRGACDADYCDYALQIGQTGKVVTPDLYIACGISGAIQHLAGMSNSKIIVAINKDPEASIFKVADYGIVGDLFEVVPLLTEEFKRLLVDTK